MDGKSMTGNNIFITSGGGGGSYTASLPLVIDGSDNISLNTVPVNFGGTGLTTIGANGTVLASNGTSLQFVPATSGGTVTSVTATAPLQATGTAVAPVISLVTNPTITSPTLVTPTLGVATATSLKANNLNASRLLIASSDKTIETISGAGVEGEYLKISSGSPVWSALPSLGVTSVGLTVPSILSVTPASITTSGTFAITTTNTPVGTGAIVLQNSPNLITPNIGAATGTSLSLSALDASRLVLTDGSKNLVTLPTSGANGQVLTISGSSPTWAAPAFSGTVTSVSMTVPSILSVSTGTITSAGTFGITTAVAPTGIGAIVLSESPSLTTPFLGVAQATSLNLTGLTASRLVLTDSSKNLQSVATAGTEGQILSISSGVPTWTSLPPLGTVTSVGLTVPPIFSVTPASITSSGTFAITTTNTPVGTGAIVLQNSPNLTTPNIGAATATSLAASGQISTTSSGVAALFGSNPVGSGSATNITVRNSSTAQLDICLASSPNQYSFSAQPGDAIIRAIGSGSNQLFLQTGGSPSIVIKSDNTVRVDSLATPGLVAANSLRVLTTVPYGADTQVLTISGGAPVWQSPSPFSGSFTASTSSFTTGTLNVTNNNAAPRCTLSALSPNMTLGQNPFSIITGRDSSEFGSGVAIYETDSITAPTAVGTKLRLGLYGAPTIQIDGNGSLLVSGGSVVAGNAASASTSTGNLTVTGNYSQNAAGTFQIDYTGIAGGRLFVDTNGNLSVRGTIRCTPNWGAFRVAASVFTGNNTWQDLIGWGGFGTPVGFQLDINGASSEEFLNNNGRSIYATVSYSGRNGSLINAVGGITMAFRILTVSAVGGVETVWGVMAGGEFRETLSVTASVGVESGGKVKIQALSQNGVTANVVDSNLQIVIH